MTNSQFGEQIIVKLLDEKFLRYLHNTEPSAAEPKFIIAEDDVENMLRYVVKDLGCTEFMAAAGRWRQDRLEDPSIFFPRVLEAMEGKPHRCNECVFTANCQFEHACCRALLKREIVNMGWVGDTVLSYLLLGV
jgi:hypothetical protein